MRKTPPSTIPVRYYDYQGKMSPSSIHAYENQSSSLFGDPVPPPQEDFLENIDSHLYGSFRRNSIRDYSLIDEFPKPNSFIQSTENLAGRRIRATSSIIKQRTEHQNGTHRTYSGGGQTRILSDTYGSPINGNLSPSILALSYNIRMRRASNQPERILSGNVLSPEINVIPGSADSGIRILPQNTTSPNFVVSNDIKEPEDATSYHDRYQEYELWTNSSRRRLSDVSDNFPTNFPNFRDQFEVENQTNGTIPNEPGRYYRQLSNESYSSSEWFKPSHQEYQEFSRIPRLRPSSKNVMSINQPQFEQSSPLALIQDSNASSSSDDKVFPEFQSQPRPLPIVQGIHSKNVLSPQPTGLPPSGASAKRDISTGIPTNAISTGSDFRVTPPRPHKNQSFTIIAERSPQSSRPQSPSHVPSFLGRGFKEPTKSPSPSPSSLLQEPQVQSASRLRLPSISNNNSNMNTSDDSPRPSVQFNMSSFPGRGSPIVSQPTPKGILQHTQLSTQNTTQKTREKVRSFEALPRITGPGSGPVPRPTPKRLNKSALDLYTAKDPEPPRPFVNPNPTSHQRGLLRVVNSADSSPSRIPIRRSGSISMDDLSMKRRPSLSPIRKQKRTCSVSPERRSSSQTEPRSSIASDRRSSNMSSITTSDFSYRRYPIRNRKSNLQPSVPPARSKKPPIRSPRKVAKPTSLSPIIGTPNKEGPSSEEIENLFLNDDRKSPEKISPRVGPSVPSAPNSRVPSRANSRPPSVANSRSNSPSKELLSRPNSRAGSRPTSRASLNQGSRAPSRATSRTQSRQSNGSANKSKSLSPDKNRKVDSRSSSPKKTRRKSISPPKPPVRSRSVSRNKTSEKPKPKANSRKSSPSKSTTTKSTLHKEPASAKKNSTTLKKPESSVKRTPSNLRKESNLKKENSNLKRTTSNLKRETTNLKRETSTLKKESSNLKRQPSNIKKEPSGLKREQSSLKKPSTVKKEQSNIKQGGKLKREPSNLMKKRTDSNLSKKLEKKGSFKNEKKGTTTGVADVTVADGTQGKQEINDTNTAASESNTVEGELTETHDTAQPVHITTAVTNHLASQLTKTNSSGQIDTSEMTVEDVNAAILEKSQKTLETIQKTVTEATEEIHKKIHENLTDLKTLETDIGKMNEDLVHTPAPFEKSDSLETIIENTKGKSSGDASSMIQQTVTTNSGGNQPSKSPLPPSQPIEAEVSVINPKKLGTENLLQPNTNHNNNNNSSSSGDGNHSSMNSGKTTNVDKIGEDMMERSYDKDDGDVNDGNKMVSANHEIVGTTKGDLHPGGQLTNESRNNQDEDGKKGSDSQEYLDEEKPTGCCGNSKCSRLCSKICMPCRRCQCCRRKEPESDTKSITTVHEVDEKVGCWKRMKCCKGKKKDIEIDEKMKEKHMETISEEPERPTDADGDNLKQNKCRLCLNKFFCCRKTNKIETTTTDSGDAEEIRKCCFCIPCKRKKKEVQAWQTERRESIISSPPQVGKCTRIIEKLKCWKKKKPDSRRASMTSKKQSIAPTNPPEDTRPKLHNDLVDYNSKMKAAIPVMPLWLAWFCMICNILVPGFGTVLSGFFCVCFGIPRFSQYDSARARFGSLVVNIIVGASQLFCVLFCLVGWGWSIWWGTIMLKTARKLKKIKRVEELELQEEERQAARNAAADAAAAAEQALTAANIAANLTAKTPTHVTAPDERDVEAGTN